MKCQVSTRFSGGGGSSRMFPWSPKADAIQWGGVVAEIFRGLQKPARHLVGGGGVVPWIFSFVGPFYIFRLSQRGGPKASPLNRPLISYHHIIIILYCRPDYIYDGFYNFSQPSHQLCAKYKYISFSFNCYYYFNSVIILE